jgi:uroporphyrin-III C-methyltransferase
MPNNAVVTFVGAGPGSADLITVRGLRAIGQADCILYDALIDEELLTYAPNALKIAVGKRAGKASTEQVFINRLLVSSAQRHSRVVRLKGGDPSIFGRLEEEMAALDAAGIEYAVVPGVTSACAAAATIKRPLTQRGVSRRVLFATPTTGRNVAQPNEALDDLSPQHADTLALYMAGRDRSSIARRLIEQGWAASTPVALVWNAGAIDAISETGTLASVAWAEARNSDAPLMILVGESVATERGAAIEQAAREAQTFAAAQAS